VPHMLPEGSLHPRLLSGSTTRRRPDSVPGNEALRRRVQVYKVPKKVDVREQLGQRCTAMHQVRDHGLSTKAATSVQEEERGAGGVGEQPSAASV